MSLEIHYNVYGCFRDPRSDIELAKRAVDAGFGGVWIGDHFHPWIDSRPYTHHVFPWFGSMMSEIPDVPVGTSVSCPMLRYRPALFAQAVATLDNMYPGRFNLGVGVGEALNEAHFIGEWPNWGDRARMLIEAIDLMRKLWESESYVSFDGEYFQHDNVKVYTKPKERISIHWAGWGPKSCELAGRFADHLLTVATPEALESRIIPNLQKGLNKADRDFVDVDVTSEFTANVGDPSDLIDEIRRRGEHIPNESQLDNPDPRDIQEVADAELTEMSDAEIREQQNITDDTEEIIEKLVAMEKAGATRVLVGSTCGDPHRTITAFEDEIIPYFD